MCPSRLRLAHAWLSLKKGNSSLSRTGVVRGCGRQKTGALLSAITYWVRHRSCTAPDHSLTVLRKLSELGVRLHDEDISMEINRPMPAETVLNWADHCSANIPYCMTAKKRYQAWKGFADRSWACQLQWSWPSHCAAGYTACGAACSSQQPCKPS